MYEIDPCDRKSSSRKMSRVKRKFVPMSVFINSGMAFPVDIFRQLSTGFVENFCEIQIERRKNSSPLHPTRNRLAKKLTRKN